MRFIKDNIERVTESEAMAAKLKALGFKLLDSDALTQEPEEGNTDIEKMTVPELKALAKERGIEGTASLNKGELLAVLKDVI
ncbi:Rho termination factor N-terminal domain-containing protein [Blautia coccoides]|uniref:Rho termination factor N-terminal domain-containing protein n=1 Tax=Blautia producta TaxID=33035 RepID=UPI0028A3B756|nr:Rho termination factor N-terminal domain-containing protein [Blautia coccoides]MDT4377089.1 Rho termination factor N-terminal domain-containing protein [Blautia coccoides]